MVHLSKNIQYGIAGALAVYIVFFTRPAPAPVVSLLSNPLSQLVVLGAIVYVGATVSLLVALIAAVAVVLSIPAREFFDAKKKPSTKKEHMDAKDSAMSTLDTPEVMKALEKVDDKAKKSSEPEPAGDKLEKKTESTGSEKFTLPGAPF